MNLDEFRQKNPAYNAWSDKELAEGLHRKYYSDMDFEEFSTQIEFEAGTQYPSEPT